ncbi:MAG: hypothetical protein M3N38_06090 [Pseudomonadota bacterium]|nr:hypothetical protein [Pseudomonadota bacterium]
MTDLWHGRLPLHVAFWRHAVGYGLALNLVTTGAMLILIVLDLPIALALLVHFLPVPYLVLAACGVWRSADRFHGAPATAQAAKLAVLAWCALLVVL